MKLRLIVDGNFSKPFRIALIILGFLLIYIAVKFISPSGWGIALMLIGLSIAAIGGYASQANTLRIKPFDSSYKKAKASYDKAEGDSKNKNVDEELKK